jgi:NADPH-dependent curcumin reductase CurA
VTPCREIHLAARPAGWPTPETFRLVESELPEPGEGQALVRNLFISVDPYMRGRMNDVKSYSAPFKLDHPMTGGAIGEVIASNTPDLAPGQIVLHDLGWRDHAVVNPAWVTVVDPDAAPTLSTYLGALGMPGLTAYVGLLDIAAFQPGDAVFVSGAAGAVGSLAGQIARAMGASRVIGSAGSAEKVAVLTSLGFDVALNYKDAPIGPQLRAAAPDGIDVYFDNVGTDHLEAALTSLNQHGRVALCGAIAAYNATEPPAAPRNLTLAIGKRLTLRGYIVSDHFDRMPAFRADMARWLAEGTVVGHETVVDGLENAPDAFLGLLRGDNVGKMVVRV